MHEFFSCSSSSPRVVSSLATPSHIAKSDHTKIRMLLYTYKFRIYWRADHLRDDAYLDRYDSESGIAINVMSLMYKRFIEIFNFHFFAFSRVFAV